jgi:UDP-N-acetylglucosamine 2-epimerase (non-hydrolysing)
MIKLITVIGTRPEIIKMSRLLSKFDKCFDHKIVHTGQNYDYTLNEIFFKDLNLRKPDYFLSTKSTTSIRVISNIFKSIENIIKKEKPDGFVVYGDTNSCLSAYVAKRYKVPIFHFEAGNRCYDENVPEEINRRIIDHISDINFVLSENARLCLLSEGIKNNLIIKTGSHMKEVFNFYEKNIINSNILDKLKLKKKNYFVASIHREENVDNDNFLKIIDSMVKISKKFKKRIIFTTHPRTKKKIRKLRVNKYIDLCEPFCFSDYVNLQKNSICVLSDSGSLTEESYICDFNAISLRTSNERAEGFDAGVLFMSGFEYEDILSCLNNYKILSNYPRSKNFLADYEVENVSEIALKSISSYINYINSNVWKKN